MTSPLLLDTHAWIWLAGGDARMGAHQRTIDAAAEKKELLMASISFYEAALIGLETESGARRGKQGVRMRPTVGLWIRDAIEQTRVVSIALDHAAAVDGALLHAMHADPFDRLIVATAIRVRARLVTADLKIIAFAKQAGLPVLEL